MCGELFLRKTSILHMSFVYAPDYVGPKLSSPVTSSVDSLSQVADCI